MTAAALALALGPTVVGTDVSNHRVVPVAKAPVVPRTPVLAAQPQARQPVADPAGESGQAPTAAAPACRAQELPTLGGRHGSAIASVDTLVVGVTEDASGAQQPVLWRNGVPTRLDTGFPGSVPTSVSAAAAVVGSGSDPATDVPVGWYWHDGKTLRLQGVEGRTGVPQAINDSGVIVGALGEIETVAHQYEYTHGEAPEEHGDAGDGSFLVNEQAHDDETDKAALWTSATAAPRILAPLAGDDGAHAFAVSGSGVAGGLSMGSGFRAVIWNGAGQARALDSLAGGWAVVRAFTAFGVPVGEASAADGSIHVVRWNADGSVVDLGAGSVQKYLAHAGGARLAAGFEPDAVGARHPVTWRCS